MEYNTEEDQGTSEGRMRFDGRGGKKASEQAEHHFSGQGRKPGLEARNVVIRVAYEGCLLPTYVLSGKGHQHFSELSSRYPRTLLLEMKGEVLDHLVQYLLSFLHSFHPLYPQTFWSAGPKNLYFNKTLGNSYVGGFWSTTAQGNSLVRRVTSCTC